VHARYEGQCPILEEPLSLPERQQVRVGIELIQESTLEQQILGCWREAG